MTRWWETVNWDQWTSGDEGKLSPHITCVSTSWHWTHLRDYSSHLVRSVTAWEEITLQTTRSLFSLFKRGNWKRKCKLLLSWNSIFFTRLLITLRLIRMFLWASVRVKLFSPLQGVAAQWCGWRQTEWRSRQWGLHPPSAVVSTSLQIKTFLLRNKKIQDGCRRRVAAAGGGVRLQRESGCGELGRGGRQRQISVYHGDGAEDPRGSHRRL